MNADIAVKPPTEIIIEDLVLQVVLRESGGVTVRCWNDLDRREVFEAEFRKLEDLHMLAAIHHDVVELAREGLDL